MTNELILRLLVSALLGGAIGFERSYRAKEAGIRTHFLVALGSALFMIISQYGFFDVVRPDGSIRADASRIAAQVVSGIGFIGAGTIIFQKHVIRGLTTAAGLWVTSAIGLTCGSGLYTLALATTVMVLIGLEAHNWVFRRFGSRNINLTFTAKTTEDVKHILESFKRDGMSIDTYNMREKDNHDGCNVSLEVKIKRSNYEKSIMKIMDELEGVTVESIE
jgi:putative Mg2+ transporter-C (MgtC) family protein